MCVYVCVCRQRERKNILRNWIIQLWSQSFSGMPAAYRPREESVVQLRPEGSAGRTLIACKVGGHSLFSLRPSTDWMRPTHMMKGNPFTQSPLIEMLISSKSIQCRIIHDLISRHHNPAKWAHKIIITLCLGILKDRKRAVWLREELGGTWCGMKLQRQQMQPERVCSHNEGKTQSCMWWKTAGGFPGRGRADLLWYHCNCY